MSQSCFERRSTSFVVNRFGFDAFDWFRRTPNWSRCRSIHWNNSRIQDLQGRYLDWNHIPHWIYWMGGIPCVGHICLARGKKVWKGAFVHYTAASWASLNYCCIERTLQICLCSHLAQIPSNWNRLFSHWFVQVMRMFRGRGGPAQARNQAEAAAGRAVLNAAVNQGSRV